MPTTPTTKEDEIKIQPNDPNWQRLQEADRRARRHPLTVTRGKNGMDQAEATRLTVPQARAYFDSTMKEFELAVRSGKESEVLLRRLEVDAAVMDLVEAARFDQVLKDLRSAMGKIQAKPVAPRPAPAHPESGDSP